MVTKREKLLDELHKMYTTPIEIPISFYDAHPYYDSFDYSDAYDKISLPISSSKEVVDIKNIIETSGLSDFKKYILNAVLIDPTAPLESLIKERPKKVMTIADVKRTYLDLISKHLLISSVNLNNLKILKSARSFTNTQDLIQHALLRNDKKALLLQLAKCPEYFDDNRFAKSNEGLIDELINDGVLYKKTFSNYPPSVLLIKRDSLLSRYVWKNFDKTATKYISVIRFPSATHFTNKPSSAYFNPQKKWIANTYGEKLSSALSRDTISGKTYLDLYYGQKSIDISAFPKTQNFFIELYSTYTKYFNKEDKKHKLLTKKALNVYLFKIGGYLAQYNDYTTKNGSASLIKGWSKEVCRRLKLIISGEEPCQTIVDFYFLILLMTTKERIDDKCIDNFLQSIFSSLLHHLELQLNEDDDFNKCKKRNFRKTFSEEDGEVVTKMTFFFLWNMLPFYLHGKIEVIIGPKI